MMKKILVLALFGLSVCACYAEVVRVEHSGTPRTANFFLAAPNGVSGAPTWRYIVEGDIRALTVNTAAIKDANVTNAKLANMATQTIKGRTTAGSGVPEDLTATQATAMLNVFVGDSGAGGTKGLVPAPSAGQANYVLGGNGLWKIDNTVPSGAAGGHLTGAYPNPTLAAIPEITGSDSEFDLKGKPGVGATPGGTVRILGGTSGGATGGAGSVVVDSVSPSGGVRGAVEIATAEAEITRIGNTNLNYVTEFTGPVSLLTPAGVSSGGSGRASATINAPIFGNSFDADGPHQSGTVGTEGQVLTSNGLGSIATFQTNRYSASVQHNFGTINTQSSAQVDIAVPGCLLGDAVVVVPAEQTSAEFLDTNLVSLVGWVRADGTVTLKVVNSSTTVQAVLTLAYWNVTVFKP